MDTLEERPARLIVNKDGRGSTTFRATLPQKWVRSLGLGEEERELKLVFDGNCIRVEKQGESV